MDLDEVCRQTVAHQYGGRVAVGNVTKLSALSGEPFAAAAKRLADAGAGVTVLPVTDWFLMVRDDAHNVPSVVKTTHRLCHNSVASSYETKTLLTSYTS